jgi:hypothetical protein
MTISRTMMPTIKHMRIFISFHHICFRTRFAPLRNPWAETARLSVLSWRESSRSPRCETLLMFSRITPTVSSICYREIQVSCGSQRGREDGDWVQLGVNRTAACITTIRNARQNGRSIVCRETLAAMFQETGLTGANARLLYCAS